MPPPVLPEGGRPGGPFDLLIAVGGELVVPPLEQALMDQRGPHRRVPHVLHHVARCCATGRSEDADARFWFRIVPLVRAGRPSGHGVPAVDGQRDARDEAPVERTVEAQWAAEKGGHRRFLTEQPRTLPTRTRSDSADSVSSRSVV